VRVDSVLLIAIGSMIGPLAVLQPGAALAASLGAAVVTLGRARKLALLVALAAALACGWRARAALSEFEASRVAARDALGEPRRCAGSASIVASPTWRSDAATYLVDFEALECDGRKLAPVRARLYGGPDDLGRGDRLELVAQLAPVRLFRNPGVLDPTPFAARAGPRLSGMALGVELAERSRSPWAWIDRARAHVRRRIAATFAPEVAGMARALVLGENDLGADDDEAFRRSGLSHLLAVSGTHLVFAVVALVRALAFVLARVESLAARFEVGRLAALLGIPLALVYADFAGGSGSAWRAAWMLAVVFAVRALGRRPRPTRAFGLSILIGAIVDPLIAFDVSFQLSALATAGLLTIGSALTRRLAVRCGNGHGWWRRFARALAASVAATLGAMVACTPLLLLLSPEVTIAGLFANVVAAPIGETIALPACLGHALLAPLPALEQGAALVGSGSLLVVRAIAHASASARWLTVPLPPPSAWQLALLAVCVTGIFSAGRARWRLAWAAAATAGLVALELPARAAGAARGQLRVTAIDVGQGDATLIDLPDGTLMLIDAGGFVGSPVDPGRSVVLPLLRVRRRARIDVVVLSHPHPDHFGGLASVVGAVPIGEFWDTGQGEHEGAGPAYAALIQAVRARGIPIRRPSELCGRRIFGGAELDVLAPCPDPVPHRHANDNSFVFRVRFGAHAALLSGDAELEAEQELLERHASRLRAELLKVGHHGSRTSTSPAFLRAVAPSVATISCGVRNRFGHPHAETLTTLSAAGVTALRLDRTGGVIWASNGAVQRLSAFSEPR
jgi:competence protein ComEC